MHLLLAHVIIYKKLTIMNCGNSKEHKDNCLRRTAKHFHRIFHSCVRLLGDVCLDVIFHSNSTKCYTSKETIKTIKNYNKLLPLTQTI